MQVSFDDLLTNIRQDHPDLKFVSASIFSWNPKTKELSYMTPKKGDDDFSSKLLHELAHAKLNHSDFKSDVELLKIESSAWELASRLATDYGVKLSTKEQTESLQSYIDWASSRSKCPVCTKNGLQNTQTEFICPNCSNNWKISRSRFKRTYRQS